MIKCACGKVIWDGLNFKARFSQFDFNSGFMNIKCSCKRWINGISIKYLTGEINHDYILKDKEEKHDEKKKMVSIF